MMFSSIVVSGIQLITKEKLTGRNITIVSVALGLGYGLGANSDILRIFAGYHAVDLRWFRNRSGCNCCTGLKYCAS